MFTPTTELDERDAEIYRQRFHAFYDVHGPRVGDFVRFADGIERRISFISPPEWLEEPDPVDAVQTSDGGSWYLGNGYTSFSGGLFPPVKRSTLTDTGERKRGRVWFFHHDYRTAHNGVDTDMDFRVFACTENAPQ
jgi:hypothetical protein